MSSQGSTTTVVCDDEHLTIVSDIDPFGSERFTGEAKLDAITPEEIGRRAGDFHLVVTWIETPFHGEAHGWVPVHFAKR